MSDNKEGGKLLQLHKSGPDEDIVSALERALQEATNGDITGGVLLLQGPGGALRQDLAGDFHSGEIILQMRQVELDLLELEFGDADPDDDSDDPDDGKRSPKDQ